MKITWIGHSCFRIEENGYSIIIDPYEDGSVPGLAEVRETADAVICTHEHGDHNFRDGVKIKASGRAPLSVEAIETFHDDANGTKRGKNRIYIISGKDSRIAHVGDLGCIPPENEKLRNLDAIMIPVGGFYTIDGKTAAAIIKELQPRIAIPMHFRSDSFGFDVLSTEEDFTSCFDDAAILDRSSIDADEKFPSTAVVLKPHNL